MLTKTAIEPIIPTQYAATVRRVIDGDTLIVALEFAPGYKVEKTLRLRGVDCRETNTAAGRAAKRFGKRRRSPAELLPLCARIDTAPRV